MLDKNFNEKEVSELRHDQRIDKKVDEVNRKKKYVESEEFKDMKEKFGFLDD